MAGIPRTFDIDQLLLDQWVGQPNPPATLLEERVLELEYIGVADEEELPGIPSCARQFAISSLQHHKPLYFVTFDDQMILLRDVIESRYGVKILSVSEAILLLRDTHGPTN